jgi:hypothetical protein
VISLNNEWKEKMINKDIKQRRGSKRDIVFIIAGNLAGHEISFVVKPSTAITDNRIIDKNSLQNGEIELVNENADNRTGVSITLKEEDTYSLEPGNYVYDLDDLTAAVTLAGGLFILTADVQTPFDNLGSLPQNCSRAVLAMPCEFEDNTFVYKVAEGGKDKFTGIDTAETKNILGIDLLESGKVDKIEGKGLSEVNLSSQMKSDYDTAFGHLSDLNNPHCVTKNQIGLGNVVNADTTNPANIIQNTNYRFSTDSEKANWNSAFSDKHTHANKTSLDAINQNLSTTGTPQFSQLGLGRSTQGAWSLALQLGLSTKAGTFIDWEGGNARLRESGYNFEFSNYDGSSLVVTFKTGGSGNVSYKPLTTNGQAYKVTSVTASTLLTASDHVVLVTASSSDKTITLPITGINDGTIFVVKKTDSGIGKVIVQGVSGTIDGQSSIELNVQYSAVQLLKNGSNYFILSKIT